MSSSSIHIALTFDDRYWAPAYALMRSICLFTYRRTDLNFHLLHRPLTPAHRAVLERIPTEFGASQTFYDLDGNQTFTSIDARARRNKRLSNIVYARILFAQLLPETVDRLLYLDCDMLVRVAIEKLYDIEMQGFPLAAAPDHGGHSFMTRRDLIDPRGLFDPAMRYFNAGLLLIDMPAWRRMDILGRFEAAITDGTLNKIYYDQDFLNLTFRDNWLELHPFWNLLSPVSAHRSLNPHILHYTGRRKPWLPGQDVPFARVYRHAMTLEIYYRYLLETAPAWHRPWIRLIERYNKRFGVR